MSVFLGFPNAKQLTVSPAVAARNLNLLRASASDLRIISIPWKHQVAYKSYVAFLPAFMEAQATQTAVDVTRCGYPIRLPIDQAFPMILPRLCVSFPGAISQEAANNMDAIGWEETTVKGQKIRIFDIKNMENVRFLATQNANRTCAAVDNTINIDALLSLNIVRRIFSSYFITNHYPAFKDKDHYDSLPGDEQSIVADSKKRKRGSSNNDAGPSKKRPSNSTGGDDDEMEENDDEDEEEHEDEAPENNAIKMALPSPPFDGNWDDLSVNYSHDGLYFPYLPELSNYDTRFVAQLVEHHFTSCLGSTPNDIISSIAKIRRDWGVIATTEIGNQLAHMAVVIRLSIQSQARAVPVFEGDRYIGSILGGYGFTVMHNGEQRVPVPRDALAAEIRNFSSHRSTVRAIAAICGWEDDEEVTGWNDGSYQFDGMMELARKARESPLSEAQRDEVTKLASTLNLGKCWNINSSTIAQALSLIADGNDLADNLPIHFTRLFESDRVSVVWSVFGAMAPSSHFIGSKTSSLTASSSPGHIVFRNVVLNEAVSNLKSQISSKAVTIAPGNKRSGPYKDRVFRGVDCQKIWGSYRVAAGATIENTGGANVVGAVGGTVDLFAL